MQTEQILQSVLGVIQSPWEYHGYKNSPYHGYMSLYVCVT